MSSQKFWSKFSGGINQCTSVTLMELSWSASDSVYSFCMSDFPSKTKCSLYWPQSTFSCYSLENAQPPFTAQRRKKKGITPSPYIIKICTSGGSGVDLCMCFLGFLLFGILERFWVVLGRVLRCWIFEGFCLGFYRIQNS